MAMDPPSGDPVPLDLPADIGCPCPLCTAKRQTKAAIATKLAGRSVVIGETPSFALTERPERPLRIRKSLVGDGWVVEFRKPTWLTSPDSFRYVFLTFYGACVYVETFLDRARRELP